MWSSAARLTLDFVTAALALWVLKPWRALYPPAQLTAALTK
jgi:hypothetical protein